MDKTRQIYCIINPCGNIAWMFEFIKVYIHVKCSFNFQVFWGGLYNITCNAIDIHDLKM